MLSDSIIGLTCGYSSRLRKEKCIVVLYGYADESRAGHGADKPNAFALAGLVSTAGDWISFSDEFEQACEVPPRTPDWHMVEAYRMNGKYKWRDEQERDARIRDLTILIKKHARYRVDSVVSAGNYEKIVRGKLPAGIDDPYFICFYSIVIAIANYMQKANVAGKVDWVFDDQGKLGTRTVLWYEWIREHAPSGIAELLGSTPIFRHDSEVLPLKAADIYAWQLRRYLTIEQPAGIAHNENLDTLLSIPGVSCYFRPSDLETLVYSNGIHLSQDCIFAGNL